MFEVCGGLACATLVNETEGEDKQTRENEKQPRWERRLEASGFRR